MKKLLEVGVGCEWLKFRRAVSLCITIGPSLAREFFLEWGCRVGRHFSSMQQMGFRWIAANASL